MASYIRESDPMVVCDNDDDHAVVNIHDADNQQEVVVHEEEEEEDDPFEKEMLVKSLYLFFTVKKSNNNDFITDNGIATHEFRRIIKNIERIRVIGMAISMADRVVTPSIFKTCDKLI